MNIKKLFVLIPVFLIFAATCFGEAEKIARVKTKENYIRESDRFYSQIKAEPSFQMLTNLKSESQESHTCTHCWLLIAKKCNHVARSHSKFVCSISN